VTQNLVCRFLTGLEHAHAKLDTPLVGELDRITDEVGYNLSQPHLIAQQLPRHVIRDMVAETQLLLISLDVVTQHHGTDNMSIERLGL
jgi:hypothetical protein